MHPITNTPLSRSVVATVLVCAFSEAAVFLLIANIFGFSLPFSSSFLLVQVLFHLCLIVFLLATKKFFYISASGRPLEKVNIANKVTLIRISMLPFVLFLILAGKTFKIGPLLIAALAITFFTDAIDGRLSRSRGEVTMIGKILDSVSDYSLLFVVAVAYAVYELLPNWIFGIIFARLLFQAIGMLMCLIARRDFEPKPTIYGKVAIATIMILFAFEPLKLVLGDEYESWFRAVEAIAGVIVAGSMIDKAVYFINIIRSSSRKIKAAEALDGTDD